jgi:glyoxylase-like metal-dependent hydrolase (beta-lactamase superfamily II)
MSERYEVHALRYASLHNRRARDIFVGHPDDGRMLDMACYVWLIRNDERTVLLDCGFNRERGIPRGSQAYDHDPAEDRDLVELLARSGVSPGDVDHVVVSHMHADHIGNLDLFTHARFCVARGEYAHWVGALAQGADMTHAVQADEIEAMTRLHEAGRVDLVDGTAELLPGIVVTEVGGHSPGLLITEVRTASGSAVLASDAVHYDEELADGRPFYIFDDYDRMLRAYDLIRAKTAAPDAWLVTGHDPADMARFPSLDEDRVDVTHPPTTTGILR